ncbi:outer membrane beta-barrel protein [Vibrio mimicus]|uniref:outer membrane beta-barrel protein n=1 Tax=Vibrio mimicus TaxID=674 RepID=UPI002FEF3FB8
MKRASIFILLNIFVQPVIAGVADGKWGVAQVFDVQRSPAFPIVGSSFTVSNMQSPYEYDGMTASQYSIGASEYITIEDTDLSAENCNYQLVLRDSGGNQIRIIQSGGVIYGLGTEGFLHVSNPGGYGTFVSNTTGYNNGDSLTYTPYTGKATCAQVEAYTANSILIAAGNTSYPPTISGSPTTVIDIYTEYSFKPSISDTDTSINALTLSIRNKPGWMTFNSATGELYGMPNEVGKYSDIQISVSDGSATASLAPFNITVNELNGTINTALSGGGLSVFSVLILLIFFFRRLPKFHYALIIASILPMKQSLASEELGWYLGTSAGYSKVTPEVNVTGYAIKNKYLPILTLLSGYSFSSYVSVEASYSRINNFEVVGSGASIEIDYNVYGANIIYTPLDELDYVTPYILAGASYFNVRSLSPLVKKDSDIQFPIGIGVRLYNNDDFEVNLQGMRYSKDLKTLTLGLVYRFGSP